MQQQKRSKNKVDITFIVNYHKELMTSINQDLHKIHQHDSSKIVRNSPSISSGRMHAYASPHVCKNKLR